MRSVLFQIGSIEIYSFGVMIALGVMVGVFFALKEAKRKGIDEDLVYNISMGLLISGILGARIFYILVYNLDYYLQNPAQIIMINLGGLSIHGGILGGALYGLWYIKRHKLDFWVLADTFAPAVILGTAIGRIGCDVFGVPMDKPYFWGVEVGGQLLHPTQAYEFMLNYLIFFVLWRYRTKIKFNGQLFLMYVIFYASARGIVELFRSNPMVGDILSVAHLSSIVFIAIALVFYYLKKSQEEDIVSSNNTLLKRQALLTTDFWVQLGTTVAAIAASLLLYYGLG